MYEQTQGSPEYVLTDTISRASQPPYAAPQLLRLTPNGAQSGTVPCTNEALGTMGHTFFSGTGNYDSCSIS